LDKPAFFLGENVLVNYCFENTADAPVKISVGFDYRDASRSLRFKTTVTDAQGTVMPDPDPSGYGSGGLGSFLEVLPGGRWCQSIPLMRYARIDRSGEYTIRIVHDLGLPAGSAPEGRVTTRFVMPTEAEAEQVVAAMSVLPRDPAATLGGLSRPYADFSSLRYNVYLQLLLRRARAGNVDALLGIGAIPSPEATRSILGLLDHASADVKHAAIMALNKRLPDPLLDGLLGPRNPFENQLKEVRKYLVETGWRPEFAADVRAFAKRLLESSETQDVRIGAFMLEAVGTPADAGALSAALARAIEKTTALPFEALVYPRPRGSSQELLRAAEILIARGYTPPEPGDHPGDIALWLVAIGRGARPAEWQGQISRALAHSIPYIREIAMTRLPADVPDGLVRAVAANLESSDVDVQIAACGFAARARLATLRNPVITALRNATESWVINSCVNALYMLGGHYERVQILAERLAEPGVAPVILRYLTGVLDNNGSSGCCSTAGNHAKELSTRWLAFIALKQADIEAGRRISLEDPNVAADLFPPGVKLYRTGKPDWPMP
jgi:hypothetical protein